MSKLSFGYFTAAAGTVFCPFGVIKRITVCGKNIEMK